MRALVIGGAGFIGAHLARALGRAGHEVVIADNLATTRSLAPIADVLDHAEFVHADVRCPEDLERLPPGAWDRVYHLAASYANALSLEHPTLDARTNVQGTANVLAHARRAGCGLFVYTGSSSSYGDAPVPFVEDGPMRPQTPYAANKLAAEWLVRSAGLDHAVMRLFNVFGPGDPPGPWRNAIPNMMRALDRPDGLIRVFGTGATRDFTYVDDVVDVLVHADSARGTTVNVATGVETPVLEVARKIARRFDVPEHRVAVEARREWDSVVRRQADVSRLAALFGRVPRPRLDEGLARTARWMKDAGHVRREPV